jgi:hypothetical protein
LTIFANLDLLTVSTRPIVLKLATDFKYTQLRLAPEATTATSSAALTLLSMPMATDPIVRALASPHVSQSTDAPCHLTPRLFTI